jgi:hypothetical protein
MSSFHRALSGVESSAEATAMAWGEKIGAEETLTKSQGRAHHLWLSCWRLQSSLITVELEIMFSVGCSYNAELVLSFVVFLSALFPSVACIRYMYKLACFMLHYLRN